VAIRLEVIALGPFVPGVHEEDALTEAADKELDGKVLDGLVSRKASAMV
jgi:hypothetical protein